MEISAGKKSSTNNHIYIRTGGKPEIYLAAGNLDSLVAKTEDDFRKRVIFNIPADSVTSFEINYNGRLFSFTKKQDEKKQKVQDTPGKQTGEDKKISADSWILAGNENIRLDPAKVISLISDFNPLRALSFINDEKMPSNRIATVKIKTLEKNFELAVFEKAGEKYPVKSSESDFIFSIDEGIVKKFFVENVEGLKAALK
jgi:hypothetical protein